jgi:hypothetical protein
MNGCVAEHTLCASPGAILPQGERVASEKESLSDAM